MTDITDENQNDLVSVGHHSREWLEPTPELRFVERNGGPVLQQKWAASATEMDHGYKTTFTVFRWKDVQFDPNPERDTAPLPSGAPS